MTSAEFEYSEKYQDDYFEFRHVILPREMASNIPKERVMTEKEWRALGVTQSRGWHHYGIHNPEPHILLFRRPLGTSSRTGKAPADWEAPPDLTNKEKALWLQAGNQGGKRTSG